MPGANTRRSEARLHDLARCQVLTRRRRRPIDPGTTARPDEAGRRAASGFYSLSVLNLTFDPGLQPALSLYLRKMGWKVNSCKEIVGDPRTGEQLVLPMLVQAPVIVEAEVVKATRMLVSVAPWATRYAPLARDSSRWTIPSDEPVANEDGT